MVLRLHFRGHKPHKLPKLIKRILLFKKESENYQKYSIITKSDKNGHSHLLNSLCKNKNEFNCIKKILLTLRSIKQMQKEIRNAKNLDNIKEANLVEWKEAARRLDNFFFVFSFLAVTLTPLYLFHYYLFDESPESYNKLTSCMI
jgi:hypothetical protein